MWMATGGYGLIKLEDFSNTTQYYDEAVPESFIVHSVDEDNSGTIWAGTDGGVFKISGASVNFITSADGISPYPVHAVEADSWGDVWLGFYGHEHVTRYSNLSYSDINLFNSMPEVYINDIQEDSHGYVWFALTANGAVKYNGSAMRSYGTADGLPGQTIMCIEEDQNGYLWFGSWEDGLARYKPGLQ